MRISDWSSDVCSSDLHVRRAEAVGRAAEGRGARAGPCRSRPGPRLCPRGRAGLAFGRGGVAGPGVGRSGPCASKGRARAHATGAGPDQAGNPAGPSLAIGSPSARDRVGTFVSLTGVDLTFHKNNHTNTE